MNSLQQHVGSSSSIRDGNPVPCIGSAVLDPGPSESPEG